MSQPIERPQDGQPVVGEPWKRRHIAYPMEWDRQLVEAARERATTVSDLIRAAIRQVMIGRPR